MKNFSTSLLMVVLCSFVYHPLFPQVPLQGKFKQLDSEWSSPDAFRTAMGSSGQDYWQQKADYTIDITLDDKNQRLYGKETIVYHNNSPHTLKYIWIQLDQNVRQRGALSSINNSSEFSENVTMKQLNSIHNNFDGGFKLDHVKDTDGNDLNFTINHTMMRVDLPEALLPNSRTELSIKWWYNINDRTKNGGRSGLEYFKDDGNYLYSIAQFYPRLAVFSHNEGWQNQQFLGDAEFALTFGNFDVSITVPADHIVASTGELQNVREVLTNQQIKRLEKARTSDVPVLIINQKEAETTEKQKSSTSKTWRFKAEKVRDFAFASSRKFIWDAMGVSIGDKKVMAMSFYPKEANPLWGKFSTEVVAHTLKVYSKYVFDYPYPVAISVEANNGGMEYPMISFNGVRPEPDGTYSERTKWGMIGTIIHEVGHNYFPMIINSDERKWAWMDEGLNTFIMGIAERQWDYANTTWMGNPSSILSYMSGDKARTRPIMTNPQSIFSIGSNAYLKTASALTILRETIMGRELFDFAFKEYARRWKFKHPTPEDFFRTMEDASAVDLDWFWRGWFYTTDHVDIALDQVKLYKINTFDDNSKEDIPLLSVTRDKDSGQSNVEQKKSLRDFYSDYKPASESEKAKKQYEEFLKTLSKEEQTLVKHNYNYYELQFSNIGGLVMPLIIEFQFEDGSKTIKRIPAEIWRHDNYMIKKVFPFEQKVISIKLDPFHEIADTDMSNNVWSGNPDLVKLNITKRTKRKGSNPMQKH